LYAVSDQELREALLESGQPAIQVAVEGAEAPGEHGKSLADLDVLRLHCDIVSGHDLVCKGPPLGPLEDSMPPERVIRVSRL
jgi:hypothetical protein